MKKYIIILFVLLAATIAQAQFCTPSTSVPCAYTNTGQGPDPPRNLQVLEGANPNQYIFSWTVTHSSYGCIYLEHDSDPTGPSVGRTICNSTPSTSISVTANGFVPNGKFYSFYAYNCSDSYPCSYTDTNASTSPWPDSDPVSKYALFPFLTAATTGGSFGWNGYFSGDKIFYQTHGWNVQFNGYQTSGTVAPSYTVLTAMSYNGTPCTFTTSPVTFSCGTGVTGQFLCTNAATVSAATNNYYSQNIQNSSSTFYKDPFCYNNAVDYGQVYIRLVLTNSSPTGTVPLSATLVQTDNTLTQMGSPVTATYSLTIDAEPTFSNTAPTMFPSIPNLGAWNAHIYTHLQDYVGLQTSNTTVPGVYLNDNGSADEYTYNPTTLAAYDGYRISFQDNDYLNTFSSVFVASASHSYGDTFCAITTSCVAGTTPVYTVILPTTGTCNLGSSLPTLPAVGSSVVSGTCTLGNLGNNTSWEALGQRIGRQMRDFELLTCGYTFQQEWAIFPYGIMMDMFREVSSGSYSTSLQTVANGCALYPFVTGNGASHNQNSIYSLVAEPIGDDRTLPYITNTYLAQWLITGTKPMPGGVDVIAVQTDLILQTLLDIITYSTTDGVNQTYACCINYPSFDGGLDLETLMDVCNISIYESSTCDSLIKVVYGKYLNWLWSNKFNLTGSDYTMPYSLWAQPYIPSRNGVQTSLNNLIAPYAGWWWMLNGDSCTYPTSNESCLTAADTFAEHTFDNIVDGSTSGKEEGQWYKGWKDYWCFRSQNCNANTISILPTQNTYVGAFPNTTEPYAQGTYPAPPSANTSATQATVTWYNFEPVTSMYVKYGTNPLAINSTYTCPTFNVVFGNAAWGLYKDQCTVNGLNPNTTYYFGVGATDSSGNTSFTSVNPNTGANYYTFTTLNTTLTLSCNLPIGQQLQFYTGTCTATNGTPPYTYSTIFCSNTSGNPCSGTTITGVTMNATSGVYSGTPTGTGVAALSVKVLDHAGNSVVKAIPVTINPSTLKYFLLNGITANGVQVQ